MTYVDEEEAKAVLEAVSPDNIDAPEGITINMYAEKNVVVAVIEYSMENLLTLQSTVDDLLSCISVAEKSISALKKKQ